MRNSEIIKANHGMEYFTIRFPLLTLIHFVLTGESIFLQQNTARLQWGSERTSFRAADQLIINTEACLLKQGYLLTVLPIYFQM